MSEPNRNSAATFSLIEENFFQAGAARTESIQKRETFEDLDEGYRPTSMWRRLFSRKATQP